MNNGVRHHVPSLSAFTFKLRFLFYRNRDACASTDAHPCTKRNGNSWIKCNFIFLLRREFGNRPPAMQFTWNVNLKFIRRKKKGKKKLRGWCTFTSSLHTGTHSPPAVIAPNEYTMRNTANAQRNQGSVFDARKFSELNCLSVWHMISTVSDDAIVCEWRKSSRHLFPFICLLLSSSIVRRVVDVEKQEFARAQTTSNWNWINHRRHRHRHRHHHQAFSVSAVVDLGRTTYKQFTESNCLLYLWLRLAAEYNEAQLNAVDFVVCARVPNAISSLLNLTTGKCAKQKGATWQVTATKQNKWHNTVACGTANSKSCSLVMLLLLPLWLSANNA